MKYELKWGVSLKLEIPWGMLHIIYGVMSFLANFIPSHDQFHVYRKHVEAALRKKILFEEEAKRFHVCERCWKEIDMRKDFENFEVEKFESGYERYIHKQCPAVNHGKGYEND